jgi:hypothetical protein
MKVRCIGSFALLAIVFLSCRRQDTTPVSADKLAEKMITLMGGTESFAKFRYLRFDFVVKKDHNEVARHSHLWDRWSGRYRVQGRTRDGQIYVILYEDINRQQGEVWVNDSLADGNRKSELLEYGYGRFINDSYWLLMPWKIKDPGVRLSFEGRITDSSSGVTYDILHVFFDSVGLTPKDRYWAFFNTTNGLMEQWKYVLGGDSTQTGDFSWRNWKSYDGVWLSDTKLSRDGKTEILNEKLQLLTLIDDGVFMDRFVPLP